MTDPVAIDPGSPLAETNGNPTVFSALGAFFHLEPIELDDEARLDRVNDLVMEWFGPRLRWTQAPFIKGIPPFRRSDLDYLSGYCRTLELPSEPSAREAAIDFHFGRDDYSLRCCGGEKESHASPYRYGFWSTFGGDPPGSRFQACPVLSLTVPDTWPHEDFAARVTAIARELRLRWATAGLTYATWTVYEYQTAERAIFAHARRHWGYDVPEYLLHTARFLDEIRSINWLTFLGPALAERLREEGKELVSAGPLEVRAEGDALRIRAGARPEAGDVNRLQIPAAYQAADALVRPVRSSGGMLFSGGWTRDQTAEWLQRFGKGGAPLPSADPDEIDF